MAARMTRSTAVVAGLALIVWFAGQCWGQSLTMTEKGLLGGGVLGAGSGAIIGAAMHHPVKGALIGGGIGALAGGESSAMNFKPGTRRNTGCRMGSRRRSVKSSASDAR